MVDFYIADDIGEARFLSHAEAVRHGAGTNNHATQYWDIVLNHWDGRVAVEMFPKYPEVLNQDVKSLSFMRLDGWFDVVSPIDGVSRTPSIEDLELVYTR